MVILFHFMNYEQAIEIKNKYKHLKNEYVGINHIGISYVNNIYCIEISYNDSFKNEEKTEILNKISETDKVYFWKNEIVNPSGLPPKIERSKEMEYFEKLYSLLAKEFNKSLKDDSKNSIEFVVSLPIKDSNGNMSISRVNFNYERYAISSEEDIAELMKLNSCDLSNINDFLERLNKYCEFCDKLGLKKLSIKSPKEYGFKKENMSEKFNETFSRICTLPSNEWF